MTTRHRIELLAPAGDERALRAALSAGADAVYFGLERWSARAFAGNFAGDQVARAVDLAHLYDARAHVALNTLLKDDEIEPALAALEAPYLAGLDALIVADLGFAALVREACPGLELHASTQLNTHSSAQLAVLARLGFARAILARELSLDEIAALDAHGLELEAFVHGALCYGYSGDCLLSSMVGGRSGNRGRCSQSCRMRYRLDLDDARRDERARGEGERRAGEDAGARSGVAEPTRSLSTSDLAAIGLLPELIAAGVTSFKVEGRMKDAAYVGVTTAVYREALDAAVADPEGYAVRPEWMARLEQSFSRSFTTAHLRGRHDEVRSGGRGGHRGVLVGRVERFEELRGEAVVRLTKPVTAGDVVYLYTSWGQTEPTRVEETRADRVNLRVRERVAVKDRLFRLAAAGVDQMARDLVAGRTALRSVGLRMSLTGEARSPARLRVWRLDEGLGEESDPSLPPIEVESAVDLAPARTAALSVEKARDALGALGGTPYTLATLEFAVTPGSFLGVADLKDMRRRAVAALDERRLSARRRSAPGLSEGIGQARPASGKSVRLQAAGRGDGRDVVLRLRPGERPLAAAGVGALCLDLVAGDPLDQVTRALAQLTQTDLPVRCRPPEILFDADLEWLTAVVALPWAAVQVRHLGLVGSVGERPVVLEYPLQGLNGLTAGIAAGLAGRPPAAVVVSPEASLEDIMELVAELARLDPAPAVEVLAFGRQQVLHTRDQLGRAEGLIDALDPAEHRALLLEDTKGYVFPAQVDADGTRLFNARVTNLAAQLGELRGAGVSRFAVVQADLDRDERRAFASGGLPALAPFATRERSTTGHLFRGVA